MELRQQIVEDQIEKLNNNLELNNISKAFQIFGHSLFTDKRILFFKFNN
jgi:hypothetical protein